MDKFSMLTGGASL